MLVGELWLGLAVPVQSKIIRQDWALHPDVWG